MIPERSLEVLRAIVQDYIQTKEPVGSKSLVERHQFGVSSATIRNEMAMLEEEELIHAPHTSAGRVPTDKGYRLFVDRLGEVKPLSSSEKAAISNFMVGSVDLDETLGRTVRLLSQLTNQVAMVQYPSLGRSRVRNIELIQSADTRVLLILITDSGRIQQHVIELNEAFAAQVLACLRAWGLPDDAAHVNAYGGGISMGHPLGASGARIAGAAARWRSERVRECPIFARMGMAIMVSVTSSMMLRLGGSVIRP